MHICMKLRDHTFPGDNIPSMGFTRNYEVHVLSTRVHRMYGQCHTTDLDLNHAVLILLQLLLDPLTALHSGGSPLLLQALQDVLPTDAAAVAQSLLQTGRQRQTLHSVRDMESKMKGQNESERVGERGERQRDIGREGMWVGLHVYMYVMHKVWIRTIHGFRCANLGFSPCAMIRESCMQTLDDLHRANADITYACKHV